MCANRANFSGRPTDARAPEDTTTPSALLEFLGVTVKMNARSTKFAAEDSPKDAKPSASISLNGLGVNFSHLVPS